MVAVYDALVNDVTKDDLITYVRGIVDEFKNVSGLNITEVSPYDPQGQFILHFKTLFKAVIHNHLLAESVDITLRYRSMI